MQLREEGKTSFEDAPKKGGRRLSSSPYNMSNLPPGIKPEDVDRRMRGNPSEDNSIFAIFRCKDDCRTLITEDHVKEMERFTQ